MFAHTFAGYIIDKLHIAFCYSFTLFVFNSFIKNLFSAKSRVVIQLGRRFQSRTRQTVLPAECSCCRTPMFAAWLNGYDVGLWPADFPWPVPELRLAGHHFVDKLYAMGHQTKITQLSILWGRYIAVWLQTKVREPGIGLRPRLYAGFVCMCRTIPLQLQCAACGAI